MIAIQALCGRKVDSGRWNIITDIRDSLETREIVFANHTFHQGNTASGMIAHGQPSPS